MQTEGQNNFILLDSITHDPVLLKVLQNSDINLKMDSTQWSYDYVDPLTAMQTTFYVWNYRVKVLHKDKEKVLEFKSHAGEKTVILNNGVVSGAPSSGVIYMSEVFDAIFRFCTEQEMKEIGLGTTCRTLALESVCRITDITLLDSISMLSTFGLIAKKAADYSNYIKCYSAQTDSFQDPRDGKIYKTVKIGDIWIMAENLAYKPSKGKYWSYGDNEYNSKQYGYLYDRKSALSVAPPGWHLPTEEEWKMIYEDLGGIDKKVFNSLKPGSYSGFNYQFGGKYESIGYSTLNEFGIYWSSTVRENNDVPLVFAYKTGENVKFFSTVNIYDKEKGYSVRLIKD
jgi:uncharacterized protein (TIGR02145 family)